jgi:two-component system CheB/CheR fusion protein
VRVKAKRKAAISDTKPTAAAPLLPRVTPTISTLYIAGLSASAGGLEALQSFFGAMPADSGVGFVVFQPLSADCESHMAKFLSTHTAMPVAAATDGITVEPNHVYLIAPGKCVKIFHGKLLISDPSPAHESILVIDRFFCSLAEDQGERAIAIALSGTGSDGTWGIRAVKEAGGLVMVENEKSAKFHGVPFSAIETGLADFILPAPELSKALLKFIQRPLVSKVQGAPFLPPEATMYKIAALLRAQSGIDFSCYKPSAVMRRLERRMGIARVAGFDYYLEYLQRSEQEVAALVRDLLITFTRFFRDAEVFAALRERIVPELCKRGETGQTIRVWVPGCATGEEAYSIAMEIDQQLALSGESREVKIFATDVDRQALAFAAAGRYPKSNAADVPPQLLERYFVEQNGAWRVGSRLREQVVFFARQNLACDPPLTKIDLIACRNLLVYLQTKWQEKALRLMAYALRLGGWLVLDRSETVGDQAAVFEAISDNARIYRKRADAPDGIAEARGVLPGAPLRHCGAAALTNGPMEQKRERQAWERIRERIIAQFVPNGLVLNENREILHSFGEPQRFLTLPPGPATFDAAPVVPHELAVALGAAISRAQKEHRSIAYRKVRFIASSEVVEVGLRVEPLAAEKEDAPLLLVRFEEPKAVSPEGKAPPFQTVSASLKRVADLEEDLRKTQTDLQTAQESKESANKKLQVLNEELLASNEELVTLNAELRQKIEELTLASNDLENFTRTSKEAAIFLDERLRIRRFTPAVLRDTPLRAHDVGRLLSDFAHPILQALATDLMAVKAGGEPTLRTVESSPGVWHLLRITPYRREGALDQSFVATILNVTALNQAIGPKPVGFDPWNLRPAATRLEWAPD